MAGNGRPGAESKPVVNTWDKTITVTTGNSARGNGVTRTIPNPNYIDRTVAPTSASDTFKKLLASGEIKPVYGQKDVSRGRNGTERVTDLSNFKGYMRTLPDGRVEGYDATGKSTGVRTPNTGGGGLFGAIGGAISDIGGGISDAVSTVSRDIASSPEAMAIITAIAASQGVDPATTAAILGANRAGKDGNIQAGLETAALSYALGSNVSPTSPTSATTAPVSGGTTGGWTSLGEAAGGTTTAAGGTTSTLLPGGLTGGAGSTTGLSLPAGSQFTGLGLETAPLTTGLQAGGGAGLTAGSTIGSALATDMAANSLAPSLGATGMLGAAQAAGAATGASKVTGSLIPGISDGLLSTGLNTLGGLIQGQSATDAAKTQADAIVRAAQIAADAAKFKPVGVTTGFGSSKFGFDDKGNLTSAGYELTPEMKAQRDALLGTSSGLLDQFKGSQAATMGMSDAAKRAMALGNQYLATDPQAQAQKYLNDQLGLLAPQRAQEMAALQAQMQAQGRGGFAIGGGVGGQGAANPQLQALFNAQLQQNNQLAADATRGGMDYAKFGAGMVGTGGDLLSSMYGTQTAAFNPYKTALGGAQTIEGLGQNALNLGMDLGKTSSTASAEAGRLLGSGMTQAANTMAPANAYSPWANLLAGGAQALQQYKFGQ